MDVNLLYVFRRPWLNLCRTLRMCRSLLMPRKSPRPTWALKRPTGTLLIFTFFFTVSQSHAESQNHEIHCRIYWMCPTSGIHSYMYICCDVLCPLSSCFTTEVLKLASPRGIILLICHNIFIFVIFCYFLGVMLTEVAFFNQKQ